MLLTRLAVDILRIVLALGVSAGLFLALPALHSLFDTPLSSKMTARSAKPVVMRKQRKEKPKPKKRMRRIREVNAQASQRNRLAGSNLKFTPDLAVGGFGEVLVDQGGMQNMVFEEGQTDEPPVPISRTTIPYPRRAAELEIEGVVEMVLVVDREGRVSEVSFTSLPAEVFRAPVTKAVRQWRFKPGMLKGVPVKVRVKQRVEFKLEN